MNPAIIAAMKHLLIDSSIHWKITTAADIQAMIGEGVEVNAKDKEDWTPLHQAAKAGKAEVIPALIEAGAYIYVTDNKSRTPLKLAKIRRHWDAARALEKAGANH